MFQVGHDQIEKIFLQAQDAKLVIYLVARCAIAEAPRRSVEACLKRSARRRIQAYGVFPFSRVENGTPHFSSAVESPHFLAASLQYL